MFFWNSLDLTRKLDAFRVYYNDSASIARLTPPCRRSALERNRPLHRDIRRLFLVWMAKPQSNLDHGTDFATWVAGIPVNMPTHAHGHGDTDLNFLIPELIEGISYRKGPTRYRLATISALEKFARSRSIHQQMRGS